MATTFSFGIQKGGVGKTTTTGIVSWLLSKNYKVLAVDFDSQGNLTQLLTGTDNLAAFRNQTVLEACIQRDPSPFIVHVTENLHLLPADDFLSGFARYLFTEFRGSQNENGLSLLLRDTLDVVKEEYDFVTIDLPPNLGEQTINGIAAADYNIVILQAEPFCYNALENYLELLIAIQEKVNPNMHVLGISTSVIDSRTSIGQGILARTREEYQDLVFQTLIHRRARISEFSVTGIEEKTKVDREVLQMYENLVEEMMNRVRHWHYKVSETSGTHE